MAARSLPVSKLRAKRRKQQLLLALISCVVFILLLGGIVGLSWLPKIRIQTIEIVGASSVNTQVLQDAVRADIAGTYHYVLAKDNIFLYPRDTIQKHVQDAYPVFESVVVEKKGLQTITINVVERVAGALWCGTSESVVSPCYLIDGSGLVYAPAADFSGEIYIKYYGRVSTTTPMQYLTPEHFRSIATVVAALKANTKEDTPTQVAVVDEEVDVTFASGFVLKYALQDTSADVLGRFAVALQAEPFTKHTLADFLYLDLRFGDKLYYKLK